jgi:hypothetical protein
MCFVSLPWGTIFLGWLEGELVMLSRFVISFCRNIRVRHSFDLSLGCMVDLFFFLVDLELP